MLVTMHIRGDGSEHTRNELKQETDTKQTESKANQTTDDGQTRSNDWSCIIVTGGLNVMDDLCDFERHDSDRLRGTGPISHSYFSH